MQKYRLLFICTANISRSKAAEKMFKDSDIYEAQSAGIEALLSDGGRQISQELLDWADIVFVMSEREDCHLSFIKKNFIYRDKKIIDLDISNIYTLSETDQELLSIELKKKLSVHIKLS